MLGAPLDLAYTLPHDWTEQVLAHEPVGADESLVRYLQEIVRTKGEISVGLRFVHDLALWVTGLRRGESPGFWPEVRSVLERLCNAGAELRLCDLAVAERIPGIARKHLFEVGRDVHSLLLEWFVLDELMQRGARPLPLSDGRRSFDWRVDFDGPLDVEVKQKGILGGTGHQIEWFWKGISLLPEAKFSHKYEWWWHTAEDCRSRDAQRMMDALWESLPQLQGILPSALATQRQVSWLPIDWPLAGGKLRLRDSHFTRSPSVAIELAPEGNPLVDVTPNLHATVFANHGANASWRAQTLDSKQSEMLASRLGRLNLARQAKSRSGRGLYVIAWWVPLAWDGSVTSEWLDDVCELVAAQNDLPYLAIWPIGLFESRSLPWSVTERTRKDLRWLAPESSLKAQ